MRGEFARVDCGSERVGVRVPQGRFGEVALAWGLCQPQDVWEAWASQLAHRTPEIDLRSFGIDAQAATHLPARVARRFGAVAVRMTGDALVVATAEADVARAVQRLGRVLRKKVRYVIAPPDQIACAIARYYPPAAQNPTPSGSSGPARTSTAARLQ